MIRDRALPSLAPTIFVVNADGTFLKWARSLLATLSIPVETFATGQEFLEAYQPERTGCLVMDLRLPDSDGLELQATLRKHSSLLSIVFVTAQADVPTAVRAIKAGALDFLEKPCSPQVLLERVRQACRESRWRQKVRQELGAIGARLVRLTPHEREIARMVADGLTTKTIAVRLGINLKTAEGHRTSIMKKLEVDSSASLVRMVLLHEVGEEGSVQKILIPASEGLE